MLPAELKAHETIDLPSVSLKINRPAKRAPAVKGMKEVSRTNRAKLCVLVQLKPDNQPAKRAPAVKGMKEVSRTGPSCVLVQLKPDNRPAKRAPAVKGMNEAVRTNRAELCVTGRYGRD
jgi:hypothetical protein